MTVADTSRQGSNPTLLPRRCKDEALTYKMALLPKEVYESQGWSYCHWETISSACGQAWLQQPVAMSVARSPFCASIKETHPRVSVNLAKI